MFYVKIKTHLLIIALILISCIPSFCRSNIDFNVCKEMIRSILVDSQNNYWIATFGEGLWKGEKTKKGSRHFSRLKSNDGIFPHEMINHMIWDGNNILLATAGKGVQAYNPQNNIFSQFAPTGDFDRLHGLIRLSSGKLILGSVGSGSAELKNGRWQRLGNYLPDFLAWVNSFYETEDNVFIATSGGLYFVPKKKEIFKAWDPMDTGLDFSVNSIMKLENTIYIGSAMRGLYKMVEGKWPKRIAESKGGFYQLILWNDMLVAAGTNGLWTISKKGKVSYIASYCFSTPKTLAINKENALLIGTICGEIIETSNLINYKKIWNLSDCVSGGEKDD